MVFADQQLSLKVSLREKLHKAVFSCLRLCNHESKTTKTSKLVNCKSLTSKVKVYTIYVYLLYVPVSDVLHSCRYQNTAPQFNGMTRVISFQVNDGLFSSAPVFAYVRLEETNDPPVLRLNGSMSDVDLMYAEGQLEPLLLAANVNITGL